MEMPDFKPRMIATIEPQKTSPEDMKAAWLAAHPVISPAQAFASSAELGPPGGSGRADNQTKNIHTEIKVNGKVIARTYNTGAVEIADEYFAGDKRVGPDLAEDRANRIKAVLQGYGAVMKDEQDPVGGMLTAAFTKAPILELLKADTALSQDAWLEERAKKGPLDPGSFFSRTA
ncbi:hypothetical protein KIP88_16360 [Bradyrhizobium sp. SRL28]|uniref:hypothetical protein n=1 Tax=Bradyrhizobium sp. SRL28 TaxID=2836178 RepID=UPI001BDE8433|nr:hypothetical protein [Bradyrhizobium sp. SRL28]MBT1512080.1 hypothetical protein [Bradyrhizobium sp. SRL28]